MNRGTLIFLITEDWFFLSHFLERGIVAKAAGYDVLVATRNNGRRHEIEARGLRFAEIPFHRRGVNPVAEAATVSAIRKLLQRERPVLLHAIALKPIIYAALAGYAGATVNAPVGLGYVFASRSLRARLLRPLVSGLLRWSLGGSRQLAVFENSEDLADFVAIGALERDRARLIKGAGVDIDTIRPTPEPPGPITITMISRMLREKGVPEFIAAARRLRGKGRDFRFLLVGGPDPLNPNSMTDAELATLNTQGIVRWLGQRSDVAELLGQSHIATLPTYYREGLPKVLLEAMAAQRAVVTTDIRGCREAVHDGENGILVPPRDVDALAAAFEKLADDEHLRRQLAARGRQMVEAEFASSVIIAQTLALYAELASA